jgi:hypothetical protein
MTRPFLLAVLLLTNGCGGGAQDGGEGVTEASSAKPAANIPDLAQWEEQMRSFGTKACNELKAATGESALGATYYDAEVMYYQMLAYTGDSNWQGCANAAESAYRSYVRGATADPSGYGAVPGFWVFTDGLRTDFERTGDAQSKEAVIELSEHGAYCSDYTETSWTVPPYLIREVAYCLNAMTDAEALGAPHRARADLLLNQLLGHLDAIVNQTYRVTDAGREDTPPEAVGKTYVQPFYIGLALKTLIEVQAARPDPRIPAAIQKAADFLWQKAWVAKDQAFFYASWATPGQAYAPQNGSPDLNLLIAPAYAWLYKTTGDAKYRDQGDQVWSGGVKGAWLDGSKQFNQNYYWSFKYVEWRK